jgi:hypothetical protein
MKNTNRNSLGSFFGAAALTLALFAPSPEAAAGSSGGGGAGKVSTHDISFLMAEFGAMDGSMTSTDGDGFSRVLATSGMRPVKIVTPGAASTRLPKRFSVAWCREASNGVLFGCKAPDYPFAPPPTGETEYDCGPDMAGNTFCGCAGLLDCVDMIVSGACVDGTLECTDDSCTCDF